MELSQAAVTTLTSEMARHPGPKRVALVSGDLSLVEQVLDQLGPKDELTIVVADPVSAVGVKARVHMRSRFVTERVTVQEIDEVTDTADAKGDADIAILTTPLTNTNVDDFLGQARSLVRTDGVISVCAKAPLSGEDPLNKLGHAVIRTDLVLRNAPPLRVSHLRFAPADPAIAEVLASLQRPSSIPLTDRMNIDSNGVVAGGLVGVTALLTKLLRPYSSVWWLPALAALPVAAFFRDPQRLTPDDPQAILAASDGTVLSVEHMIDERLGTDEWLRIAVFLSVLDVHINRSPVAGRVVEVRTESGGYAMAQRPEADHNVSQYTVLETQHGRVVVAQRTGLLARRIVNRARVGALLAKGERFGLIRFGSRTDVYLPVNAAHALVEPGDQVRGGETLLARWAS